MLTQIRPGDFNAWCMRMATESPGIPPLVLDVREPWELQTASVQPSGFELLVIPMREVPARLAEIEAEHGPDRPIACLCHHGMRSLQVANYLSQNGFSEVVNIAGGIDAWSHEVDGAVPTY